MAKRAERVKKIAILGLALIAVVLVSGCVGQGNNVSGVITSVGCPISGECEEFNYILSDGKIIRCLIMRPEFGGQMGLTCDWNNPITGGD